jgi:serine/threonine protein phosphatase PrpC
MSRPNRLNTPLTPSFPLYRGPPGGSLAHALAVAARIKEGPAPVAPLEQTEHHDMTGPIIAFAATDRGLRRSHNEDAFLMDEGLGLYVVADGMGGARGGEVASQMAVRCMRDALMAELNAAQGAKDEVQPLYQGVAEAVAQANLAIFRRADREPNLLGMGTTLTGLAFTTGHAILAHVGDSRAYRIRGRTIEQVSEDHTYAQELVRAGSVRPEDTHSLPFRHVLSRAVGVEPSVRADLRVLPTQPGDLFVLCSDGLANVVSEDEIRDAVLDTFLRGAPDRLVRLANQRGGPDNITVLVMCVNDQGANDHGDGQARRSA